MSFSDDFLESIMAQQTENVILTFITLQFKKNSGEIFTGRYVSDFVPHSSVDPIDGASSVLFQPAAFKVSLGSDTEDSVTRTNLVFDAGDLQLIRELRESDESPVIYLHAALASTPDYVEIGPVELQAESFTIKSTSVSVSLTIEPVLNEPVPAKRYTPNTFPMLWRGELDVQ